MLEWRKLSNISDGLFGYYHNPLIIVQAVSIFLLFRNFTFKNKIINELAKGAFTCYLLNGFLFSRFGRNIVINHSVVPMLLLIIAVTAGTYLLAYFVYKVYSFVMDGLLKRVDKEIRYWDDGLA